MSSNIQLGRITQCFLVISAVLLSITGIAKLYAVLYLSDASFEKRDIVFTFMRTKELLFSVAVYEMFLSAYTLVRINQSIIVLKLILVTTLCFVLYRLGIFISGAATSCSCMGGGSQFYRRRQ